MPFLSTRTDLAALDVLDSLGDIHGHGAGLGVRHQATRTEHTAQTADLAHHVRRATTASKSRKPPCNLCDQVVITDDVGASLGSLEPFGHG